MVPSRAQFGGLGALIFLGTFAGIAAYVQERSRSQSLELQTTAVAGADRVGEANLPPTELQVGPSAGAITVPASAGAGGDKISGDWRAKLDFRAIQPLGPALEEKTENQATAKTKDSAESYQRLAQTLDDGHKILFTLDPGLQEAATTIFRNREVPFAAAVVLDLHDNAVLAMAAHSSMDAEADPLEILGTPWAPAASVFKVVTAEALLHTQKASPASRACFHGGLSALTDDLLRDNPKLDKRCETLASALAHSHNVVIAKLALRHLTQDDLNAAVTRFAFGQRVPFEFPLEPSVATIPADARARAKVAAGFWQVDLSPMHAALMAATIARNGLFQAPHVVAQVLDPDGKDITPSTPPARPALDASVARRLGKMLLATTTEGTARQSFYDAKTGVSFTQGITVAGKTGNLNGRRAPSLNYNWFIGYAPAENPEIAFAVLLANPAKWQIKAHYAARRLIQVYLTRRDQINTARHDRLDSSGKLTHSRAANPSTSNLSAEQSSITAAKSNKPRTAIQASADDLRLAQRDEVIGEAPANSGVLPQSPGSATLPPATTTRVRTQSKNGALPPVPGPLPPKPNPASN
jgi:membrane peptidoglycan carboxypeptidase